MAGGRKSRNLQKARIGKLAKKMGRLRILATRRKMPAKIFGRMRAALLAGPLFG